MNNPTLMAEWDILRNLSTNISRRIKYLRELNDIKQNTMARDLNIPRSTLSEYECGKKIPTLENLIRIALYFNVSCDFIIGIGDYLNDNFRKNPEDFIALTRLSDRDAFLVKSLISSMEISSMAKTLAQDYQE